MIQVSWRGTVPTWIAGSSPAMTRGKHCRSRRPHATPEAPARVVELVDTRDLKSLGSKELCRFESGRGHQRHISPEHRSPHGASMSQVFDYASTLKSVAAQQIDQIKLLIEHPGEKGRSFEHVVRGMLRPLLPRRYAIGTGFLVASDGSLSKQTDIVVYDELMNTPVWLAGEVGVFPIECVYAAIEVKSWIDNGAIEEAAKAIGQMRALKEQKWYRVPVVTFDDEGNATKSELVSAPSPIAPRSYLFCFDAKQGSSLESITQAVEDLSRQHNALFHGVHVLKPDWLVRQVTVNNKIKTKSSAQDSWILFARYLLKDLSAFSMFPADMERYLDKEG